MSVNSTEHLPPGEHCAAAKEISRPIPEQTEICSDKKLGRKVMNLCYLKEMVTNAQTLFRDGCIRHVYVYLAKMSDVGHTLERICLTLLVRILQEILDRQWD